MKWTRFRAGIVVGASQLDRGQGLDGEQVFAGLLGEDLQHRGTPRLILAPEVWQDLREIVIVSPRTTPRQLAGW
jgi:hypothetical protein